MLHAEVFQANRDRDFEIVDDVHMRLHIARCEYADSEQGECDLP